MNSEMNFESFECFFRNYSQIIIRVFQMSPFVPASAPAEVLDGTNKYRCESCKTLSAARKCFRISAAPPVLVVHLKRFSALSRKITRPIHYQRRLSLAQYVSSDRAETRPAEAELSLEVRRRCWVPTRS